MKTSLFVLLVCLSYLSFANNNDRIKYGINSSINIELISNNSFNNYLINSGYYSSSNILNNTSLGFSIRPFKSYSMITLNFIAGKSSIENSENRSILYSNSIDLYYSYDLIKPEAWFIGPSFGFKLSNYKLAAVSKNSISPLTSNHFEEFIQIDNSPIANLGIQLDKKMHIYYTNFYFGFRAGYNINLSPINWDNSKSQKLINIPNINLSGISVGFNLRIELDEIKMKDDRN